ncbi:unnamed protein product [Moneuplotes crassus]|uniref:Hexose transporter 1 n=1 Tax=Euplotes crassus TaxID=5936 RepID=A0AAD1U5Z9_EUPCR|nr:unnamed protein product [Moneuplotes crassus]
MGHFHFGYLIHMMSILWDFTPCIYGFHPRNIRTVNVIANFIFLIMAAISSAFSWKFARFGKRKALIISSIIIFIGSSLLYIRSLSAMIIGRGIVGFGFGISSVVGPLFINEIAGSKYIEYCIATIQFWINIGFLIPSLLDFSLPREGRINPSNPENCLNFEGFHFIWREMIIPITLASVIQFVFLLLVFKKENPIYVQHCKDISHSLGAATRESTQELYHSGINYEEDSQQSSAKVETCLEKDTWKNMWKLSERKKIIASMIVRGFQQLTGMNVILNYGLTFIYDTRFPRISLSFSGSVTSMFFLIPSVYLLKKFGRKSLMMTGMIMACFSCCILFQMADQLAIVDHFIPIFGSMPNLTTTIFVWVFTISFWLNLASTPVLYCTETLTDKGMSIVTAFHWSLVTFVILLPSLAMAIFEQLYSNANFRSTNAFFFFLFSGTAMIGFFCTALFVVETKGKSKRQLSEDFKERVFSLRSSKIYKN